MPIKRISILTVLLLVGALAFFPLRATIGSEDKQAIEKIVHDYLIENPELIKEALQALQVKEAQAQREETIKTIKDQQQAIFKADSPGVQPENANVVLVEFFDYQCKYCRNMSTVMETIKQNNPDLQIIYKDLPILGGHSVTAAKAALAARKQGKYMELHKALMGQTGKLSKEKIMEIATSVGIDTEQLEQDMNTSEINDMIETNVQLARNIGIRGIPAIIVAHPSKIDTKDPMFLPGAVSESALQEAIDSFQAE